MIRMDLTSIDEQWRQIVLWLVARGCRGDVVWQAGGPVGQRCLCHSAGGRTSEARVSGKVAPVGAARSTGVRPFAAGFARPPVHPPGGLWRRRELVGRGAGAR